jgi:uncharacterized protein
MIERIAASRIKTLARQFPIVVISGPRQSGKTTLIRHLYPHLPYINLERPDIRERVITDPVGNIGVVQKEGGILIDEAQHFPELTSWLQSFVDENPKPGRFFLTGSNQPLIRSHISQSLAGRAAYLNLLPFCIQELRSAERSGIESTETERLLWKGFYPPLYDRPFSPEDWYPQYVQTYLERDVPHIISLKNRNSFHRFLRLLAGRTGQRLNMSDLARDADVSHTTVREWLSVLEAGCIIFLLQPWFENYSKRLVKSPKIYFYDAGLAGHLAGITAESQWETHPLRGAFFESMVVSDIVKRSAGMQPGGEFFYWSAQGGPEIDLLYREGTKMYACEIKSSATFRPVHTKNLETWAELSGIGTENLFLLYNGNESFRHKGIHVLPWREHRLPK